MKRVMVPALWVFVVMSLSYTGIRTDRYKYIEFARGRSPWLFDLLNDPLEMHNLMDTPQGRRSCRN